MKRTTLQRSNPGYNAACCSCTKTICSLQIYTILFDRLAHSGRACTAFPNTRKKDVPLRPILSMTGSAQNQLAKYLSSLLELVLTLYSSNCIRDSFTFADIIKTSNLDPSSVFLCSFDISSLFTNVPLAQTIQICADTLYSSKHPPAPFHGKSSSNLWRWLPLLLILASITSCIAKSTDSPWDTPWTSPCQYFGWLLRI